jgi:hypothetical protein
MNQPNMATVAKPRNSILPTGRSSWAHITCAAGHFRFCNHCRAEISVDRLRRGSHFCSRECADADRKERRAFRATIQCRLCGRGPKKERVLATDDVRGGHNPSEVTS